MSANIKLRKDKSMEEMNITKQQFQLLESYRKTLTPIMIKHFETLQEHTNDFVAKGLPMKVCWQYYLQVHSVAVRAVNAASAAKELEGEK